jgi:hypothetical protein
MGMPRFFAINDRPVKVVEDEGGWHAFALDMRTGEWVDGEAYLDRYMRRDGDIDLYTEQQFNDRVAEVRKEIGQLLPEESDLPDDKT